MYVSDRYDIYCEKSRPTMETTSERHAANGVAAKPLHERIRPAMHFCRLFGFGIRFDGNPVELATDVAFLLVNLWFSTYAYVHITAVMRTRMSGLWDITTVMSVVKVYSYLMRGPVTMIAWQMNERRLASVVRALDGIVPGIERRSLARFPWATTGWMLVTILGQFSAFSTYHVATNFEFFSWFDYFLMAVYSLWFGIPVIMYMFLVQVIRAGVRDVNDRIDTVTAWRAYRGRWKELRRTAVHLARDEFGVIAVVFWVGAITEIVFSCFTMYFFGYKTLDATFISYVKLMMITVNGIITVAWVFEITRITQNCKLEVNYC